MIYDRMRLVSLKKRQVLCKKNENWTDVSCTAQPVDYIGLPNDLVDCLIGRIMKLANIYFSQSICSIIYSNVRKHQWN